MAAGVTASKTEFALPSLTGKVALVTGANSGIGFEVAGQLARAGAEVVLGCRSPERAAAAMESISAEVPEAKLDFLQIDLGDLDSVREAVARFTAARNQLDILCNNAGTALSPFSRTASGFELHLGSNFLGHFALSAGLIDLVMATPGSRVVTVGSLQHRMARVHYRDPNFHTRGYSRISAYGQSKLANLHFMLELDRRLRARGSHTISVGGHPGFAATGIGEKLWIVQSERLAPTINWVIDNLLHTNTEAARPILTAIAQPGISGGSYFGPGGRLEIAGHPAPAKISRRALNPTAAAQTWAMAEKLTGVTFEIH